MTVLRRASPETLRDLRGLRDALAGYAERRGDRLEVRYKACWIAYRSRIANRTFAEVRPGKRGIEAFLLPSRGAMNDPSGVTMAVPASRGWGWFQTRAKVEVGRHAVLASLLRQSYEHARRMPSRRGGRARGAGA